TTNGNPARRESLDLPRGGRYEPPAHGAPVAPARDRGRRARPARGPDRGLPRRGHAGGPAPRPRRARALPAGGERAAWPGRDGGPPRGTAAHAPPRPRRSAADGGAGDGRRQQPVGACGRRAARRAGETPPPGRADRALGSGGAGGGGPPAPDRAGGPEPAAGLRGAHHAQRPAVDRLVTGAPPLLRRWPRRPAAALRIGGAHEAKAHSRRTGLVHWSIQGAAVPFHLLRGGRRRQSSNRPGGRMSPTERNQRIAQIMDEAYKDYEDGLAALRRRVVEDMRRKLKDGGVLDSPDVEQSSPREQPTPVV